MFRERMFFVCLLWTRRTNKRGALAKQGPAWKGLIRLSTSYEKDPRNRDHTALLLLPRGLPCCK